MVGIFMAIKFVYISTKHLFRVHHFWLTDMMSEVLFLPKQMYYLQREHHMIHLKVSCDSADQTNTSVRGVIWLAGMHIFSCLLSFSVSPYSMALKRTDTNEQICCTCEEAGDKFRWCKTTEENEWRTPSTGQLLWNTFMLETLFLK